MISNSLSIKIKILSLIAIICVLMIHTTYEESSNWYVIWFIQRSISSFSNYAVPFFFIISGFLFFQHKVSRKALREKIHKRIYSLLIPYLIWCIAFLIIVAIINLFVNLNSDYFILLREHEYLAFFKYAFWTPAAFHLWYIRDLFIIICLSPLIAIPLVRYPACTVVISLVLCGILRVIPILSWGLWWFTLGSFYAVKNKNPFYEIPRLFGPIALIIGVLIVLASTYFKFPITPDRWYSIPTLLLIIIGIWKCYDYVPSTTSWIWVTDFTFIIYCAHIPILNIIKKAFYPILDNSAVGCIIGYILSPFICILTIIIIAKLLNRYYPNFSSIIFGGRVPNS